MVYRNKNEWIIPKVVGKNVLDLGCVRHDLDETTKEGWLHGHIVNNAATVTGVDYLEEEVNELVKKGYNMVCANVETMDLGNKYELIVAGDLIEHLSNFGMFLERVYEHLKDNGEFVVTTPNPVNIFRFMNVLAGGKAGANQEHTCWFTEQVLEQLVVRYGFKVKEVAYVDDSYQYYKIWKWWPFMLINYLICRIRPAYSETICMVLTKQGA